MSMWVTCQTMAEAKQNVEDKAPNKGDKKKDKDDGNANTSRKGGKNKQRGVTSKKDNLTPFYTTRDMLWKYYMRKICWEAPRPMKREYAYAHDKNKCCAYHYDFGHSTKDCIQLKREIQKLINEGYLAEFNLMLICSLEERAAAK